MPKSCGLYTSAVTIDFFLSSKGLVFGYVLMSFSQESRLIIIITDTIKVSRSDDAKSRGHCNSVMIQQLG